MEAVAGGGGEEGFEVKISDSKHFNAGFPRDRKIENRCYKDYFRRKIKIRAFFSVFHFKLVFTLVLTRCNCRHNVLCNMCR